MHERQSEMGTTPSNIKAVNQCLRALGNERRLRIVSALTRGPWNVTDLSTLLRCSLAATSRHLLRLKDCGMVEREQRSMEASYTLVRTHPFIRVVLPMLGKP